MAGSHLAISAQVNLQRFAVILKPKRRHGEKNVLAVDGFALLLLALFRCCEFVISLALCSWLGRGLAFTGDEGNELAHTFLHAFFGFFCDLGIIGECCFHDPRDYRKVLNVSLRRDSNRGRSLDEAFIRPARWQGFDGRLHDDDSR